MQSTSDQTLAEIGEAHLAGAAGLKFPTERSFAGPLLITALAVLLPLLLLWWQADEALNRSQQILWGNGISPFIVWFFAATALYLVQKKAQLKREMATSHQMVKEVIPRVLDSVGADIAPAELFVRLKEGLMMLQPEANQWNLMLSRCRLLLIHAASSGEQRQLEEMDDDAGLFEREYMRASYALPRFMIWAIPILGFIGTVWGIGNGVAAFSTALGGVDSAMDVSAALKENLPLVTTSLAAAFDTTFLALLLSVPLMLMMTWFEKAEEGYLILIDELWLYDLRPMLFARLILSHHPLQSEMPPPAEVKNRREPLVADEIALLSRQIEALQQTMENLYQLVFSSSLKDSSKE